MSKQFVICTSTGQYKASLEPRKLYEVKADPKAKAHGLLRVVDESGEDYLYPASLFESVNLSDTAMRKLTAAKRQSYSLQSQS